MAYTITGLDGADNLIGGADDEIIHGMAGDDYLNGMGGKDTLYGGQGNDTYRIWAFDEAVEDSDDGGVDYVVSDVSYQLGAFIENLTLLGSANLDGRGNGQDNNLTGNAGNNLLDGGIGNDVMMGGRGDDTYVVNTAGDSVLEYEAEGIDEVRSFIDYTLGSTLENLRLVGTSLRGTGNERDNVITGNSLANMLFGMGGNDTFDGRGGNDQFFGGAGDDLYEIRDMGDLVIEDANNGTDLVRSLLTYTLSDNVENLTLIGAAAINGYGNALANTLHGDTSTAANTLAGGLGMDKYYIGAGDVVVEAPGEGWDEVHGNLSFALAANVEHGYLHGNGGYTLTGNAQANVLHGETASGADTLIGRAGDDVYFASIGDVVVEEAGGGFDTVRTYVSMAVAANVEKAVAWGGGRVHLTGNGLDNILIGNANINTLDGGAGADTMSAGPGDDTYLVDSAADLVVENAEAGRDTIRSTASYLLPDNVEIGIAEGGAAVNLTGNGLANKLYGNGADNILAGGGNGDRLDGGGGNDTLIGGEGRDSIVGGAGADSLIGDSGNDVLIGNSGADLMRGGAGDDLYVIEDAADVIVEQANEGTDTVRTYVSLVLSPNVERAFAMGEGAIDLTGNGLDNYLTGNSASNVLEGGDGNDLLQGGDGADTLIGGDGADRLFGNSGDDTLIGGSGFDKFYFSGSNIGNDVIIDWTDTNSHLKDFIHVPGRNFSHVHVADVGSDLLITIDGLEGSIRLVGVSDAASLTDFDFRFA